MVNSIKNTVSVGAAEFRMVQAEPSSPEPRERLSVLILQACVVNQTVRLPLMKTRVKYVISIRFDNIQ